MIVPKRTLQGQGRAQPVQFRPASPGNYNAPPYGRQPKFYTWEKEQVTAPPPKQLSRPGLGQLDTREYYGIPMGKMLEKQVPDVNVDKAFDYRTQAYDYKDPDLKPYLDEARSMTKFLVDRYKAGDEDAYKVLKDMTLKRAHEGLTVEDFDPNAKGGFTARSKHFDEHGLSESDVADVAGYNLYTALERHMEDYTVSPEVGKKMRKLADENGLDTYVYHDLNEGLALNRLMRQYYGGQQ